MTITSAVCYMTNVFCMIWIHTHKIKQQRQKLILFSILLVILDFNTAEQTRSSEWSTDADKNLLYM